MPDDEETRIAGHHGDYLLSLRTKHVPKSLGVTHVLFSFFIYYYFVFIVVKLNDVYREIYFA